MFNAASGDSQETELKKPLSLWEKFKTGTVSFVKAVLDYVPKGIIMSAVFVGGAMLMANIGGWDPLNMAKMTFGAFLQRTALVVSLGSIINGSIGAYQGVKAHTEFRNKEIELQQLAIVRERKRGPSQEKEKSGESTAYAEEVLRHGLPDEVSKSLTGPGLV